MFVNIRNIIDKSSVILFSQFNIIFVEREKEMLISPEESNGRYFIELGQIVC